MKLNQHGMTVVELLVVISVSGILMTTITAFALNYWTISAVLQSDEQTLVTRLNAGDYLRSALDAASGLITQNDLPDAHTSVPDPAIVSGNYWIPIHAVPGTITMGGSGTITPLIYFDRPSISTSKSIIMNGAQSYQDDVILYLDGSSKQLMARTIANTSAANNRARTTCPPSIATNTCPPDQTIATDVSSITMRYFSRSGNTIDYTSIVDPLTGNYIGPDFPSVEVVEFNLQLLHKAQLHSGVDTTNQTIIRVALRN